MPIERDPERVEIQQIAEFVNLRNQRVLEIGSGIGRLVWRYAPIVASATGVDINIERLVTARLERPQALAEKTSFVCASATALPLPPEHFNAVIFGWSL